MKDQRRIPDFIEIEENRIQITPLSVSNGTYILEIKLSDSLYSSYYDLKVVVNPLPTSEDEGDNKDEKEEEDKN